MPFHKSWLGYVLAAVYIAAAIPMIHHALTVTGGWISLRRLDIALVTIPSSFTFGLLFEALGWKPDYNPPSVAGYADIAFHVLVTALVIYAIGYGIEWAVRRLSG